eukprot:s3904_g1.t1
MCALKLRRGTCGIQLALVTRLVLAGAASLCVAGVALGDMASLCVAGVTLAWHLATSTFTLCGRRGTYGTQLSLVTRLVQAGAASFFVAGVALGDIDLHFVLCVAATWAFTLCGKRGSYGTQLALVSKHVLAGATSFCVAGVALGDIDLHFLCQAWHLATWTFTLRGRCGTYGTQLALLTRILRGRRGTWRHRPSLCDLATWTFTLCGRRGTCGTQLARVTRLVLAGAASFCVAGVALGDIDLHFLCQAWHLATWTFTLRGRCGTYGTQLALLTRLVLAGAASFCVAGLALGDIDLHFVQQAATWAFTLCGRRATWRHRPSLSVSGVALGDIDLHFLCQAWHLATWTFTLCGRRGTYGTQLALVTRLVPAGTASLCVAGVALGDIDLHFAWQAWHLATWTFTLCGKGLAIGTIRPLALLAQANRHDAIS